MATNVIDWTTFVPATRVNNYRRTYVQLPAFTVADVEWAGASQVVLQYNYSADKSFVLSARPTKPSGVNFGLCVRWRVGDEVFRYKLWRDDAFILSDDAAPLYTGQVIKPNFVLEIWNLEDLTEASLEDAIDIYTSVRTSITALSERSAAALCEGEAFSDFAAGEVTPVTEPPSTGRLIWCRSDQNVISGGGSDVGFWQNIDNVAESFAFGGAPAPQIVSNQTVGSVITDTIQFVDSTTGRFPYSTAKSIRYVAMLVKLSSFGVLKAVHGQYNAGADSQAYAYINRLSVALQVGGGTLVAESATEWYLVTMAIDETSVNNYDIIGNIYKAEDFTTVYDTVTTAIVDTITTWKPFLGKDFSTGSAGFEIADYVAYDSVLDATATTELLSYFASRYNPNISLPLSFNEGGPWLDNS